MRLQKTILFSSLLLFACGSPQQPPPDKPPQNKRPPRRPGMGGGAKGLLKQAIRLAEKGDLEGAIERCQEAIAKNPQLEHAYLLWGSSCAMKGDAACERKAYEEGIAALPRSVAVLKERAMLDLQAGRVQEAVKDLEQVNELTGNNKPEHLADLAYAYIFVKKAAEAVKLAAKSRQLGPKCFQCAMSHGEALIASKSFGEAVDAYRAATKIQPNDGGAHHGLGKALFLAGQHEDAYSVYEKLVAQQPKDARLRIQAGQVAMKLKRYKDAAQHYKAVAADHGDNRQVLEHLLEAQKKAGDRKGAKETKKRIRGLGPGPQ